jgi:hypothetical protein
MSEKYDAISSRVGGCNRIFGSWLADTDWE